MKQMFLQISYLCTSCVFYYSTLKLLCHFVSSVVKCKPGAMFKTYVYFPSKYANVQNQASNAFFLCMTFSA